MSTVPKLRNPELECNLDVATKRHQNEMIPTRWECTCLFWGEEDRTATRPRLLPYCCSALLYGVIFAKWLKLPLWLPLNILTHVYCFSRAPLTKHHRRGGYPEICFLTMDVKVLTGLFFLKASLIGLRMAAFSLCIDINVPLCAHIIGIPSSYKDTSHIEWGPQSYDLI